MLTITVAVYAHVVGAFVPKSAQFTDMKTSFDAMMKPLMSSRAEPVVSQTTVDETRTATGHKRWGIDNKHEDEYWNDSRIHTLGNNGFFGAVSRWLIHSWGVIVRRSCGHLTRAPMPFSCVTDPCCSRTSLYQDD
jgi:hypothetical protein